MKRKGEYIDRAREPSRGRKLLLSFLIEEYRGRT